MSKQREQLAAAVETARWHLRFDWLRAREHFGAEAALERDVGRDGWRVTKNNGRRCVGTGTTLADAIDAAMRNPTA